MPTASSSPRPDRPGGVGVDPEAGDEAEGHEEEADDVAGVPVEGRGQAARRSRSTVDGGGAASLAWRARASPPERGRWVVATVATTRTSSPTSHSGTVGRPSPALRGRPYSPGAWRTSTPCCETSASTRRSLSVDDTRLITAAAFEALGPLSAADVAERAGVPVEAVVAKYALLGIDVGDPAAPGFQESEVAFVQALVGEATGVLSGTWGDDLLRVVGTALARVADGGIAGYVAEVEQGLAEADAPPTEWMRSAAAGMRMIEHLSVGLAPLLTRHFFLALDRQRVAQDQVRSRLHFRYAVGFVDLVGFTSFSRSVDARQLVEAIRRFENAAHDVAAAHGGRIVKLIGDEVMFTALDPAAACAIARELVGSFAAQGVLGRGGIAWGELLSRGGDFYGPVVNLAARLVDGAVQGEVLVDEAIASALGPSAALEPSGRRQLKGFDDPVRVWSIT